jgi:hypothetical protein
MVSNVMAKTVHLNMRVVSAGKPVAYCHAMCDGDDITHHERHVTCEMCCEFLGTFSGEAATPMVISTGRFATLLIAIFASAATILFVLLRK